ncbi:hypothetical protein OsI_17412 [Oryza sativa Indica Group]|uniref:non-specific serine/threonine protein kinase n=1 Tax=Oryza sativa subsp. indica TaxID=39946 RepID=B8AU77_ORYSI|nr:hypothetical protein OsI_17412 [Oryza sativa Indica Group]
MALSVLLLLLAAVAQAQKAPTATTDRIEAEALKAVFEKLDQKAEWNTTGDPCSGAATDSTDINDSSINPAIKCDCSDQNNTVCHITGLKIYDKDATGQIPGELRNLTHLTHLNLSHNFLVGTIPSFIGELAAMQYMTFGINALSGSIPKELGNLTNLVSLGFSSNNFSGSLPSELGSLFKLEELYIDSAGLSGELPSSLSKLTRMKILWASDNNFTGQIPDYIGSWNLTDLRFQGNSFQGPLPANLSNLVQLTNLILRNCMISDSLALIDFSKFASLTLLDFSYNQLSGNFPFWVSEEDLQFALPSGLECLQQNTPCFLGSPHSASFAVDCGSTRFISGSRNSSYQADATNLGAASYHVTEPLTWEFGFEDTESWKSRGRRVFDIYVQGERKEKDFDIKKEAGGKSYTAVKKDYIVSVTKNFVEIHLFWAGKGTCCIPTQGYYGPTISALSLSPSLVALVGIFLWRKKRRKLSLEQQELYSIVGRPNIFSYGELRSATENFSSSNRLGEGGYGAVYKGKLMDGRIVAVKQLSQTSHQGKKQFATEIETISRVQHRNLVKLYGCCLEGNNPLLVYEYMENGSLDKALFGTEKLHIGWPARFEICLGIARGLAYLHEESSIRVVHRDIKASNVLLDANLNPKISDFGLAKLYDDKMTHVSTKVAGTFGYLAPEYAMRGHMTEKVDVFAFGVVLLETLAGRPNYDDVLEEDKIYIFEWVSSP